MRLHVRDISRRTALASSSLADAWCLGVARALPIAGIIPVSATVEVDFVVRTNRSVGSHQWHADSLPQHAPGLRWSQDACRLMES